MSAASPSPSGTVTFLFSDIEGSTRLVDRLGAERYGTLLAAHQQIIRDAIARAGGHEIKTEGDSFFVVFTSAIAAVTAAAEAQRGLYQYEWPDGAAIRVRIGMHTGEGVLVGSDYVGIDVHRAARIAAVGQGGQVLLSGTTRTLVAHALPDGVALRDLGEHRLKDLSHREDIAELVIEGLPSDFGPLRTLDATPNNLPTQLTTFLGRERELADVRSLAEAHRLVTLVGTGGTGKTRLMLQAASALLGAYRDGAWLVELAPIVDEALVVPSVARAIGAPTEIHRDVRDSLIDFLRSKSMLLLLDNCEHIIGAVADVAAEILAKSPGVTILASSREPVGIAGEAVFPVPSLGLPPSVRDADDERPSAERLDAIVTSEAVRLFVERAEAVVPDFTLTPRNAAWVAEICRRLDGIPLAIELAAARVTVLSPQEIARGLGDRFRLLTGGRRAAVPRQRTLEALIDWSWDLLTDHDRRLLAQLSVFAGGWALEPAAAVTGAANAIETLDGLTRLADRSLIVVEHGDVTRYRMLETIRQYAGEKLAASGETSAIRDAHASFFAALAVEAGAELRGPRMVEALRRLDAEMDNLRSALDWSFEDDPERAMRMTVALGEYARSRLAGAETVARDRRAAELALSLMATDALDNRGTANLIARTLATAAFSHAVWGDVPHATSWGERAVAIAREIGDERVLLDALSAWTLANVFAGRDSAWASDVQVEVVSLAERLGDWWTLAFEMAGYAMALVGAGDLDAAEERLERASSAAERSGNPSAIAFTALARGRLAGFRGRLPDARRWFADARAAYEHMGDTPFVLIARSDLAHALRLGGELAEAEAMYRETIHEWQHLGSQGALANQLECFAFIAVETDRALLAARLLGAAERGREIAEMPMLPFERPAYDRAVARLRQLLPDEERDALWALGRTLTLDAAVELALSGGSDDAPSGR